MAKILKIDEMHGNGRFWITDYFDLNTIPKDVLASKCVDFSFMAKNQGYGKEIFVNGDEILAEKKYFTATYETVKETLRAKYKFDDWQFAEDSVANNVRIIILFVDIKRNKDIMLAEMKSLGWSESFSDETVYQGFRVVAISFDPIYQMSVSDEAHSFEFLYHWTPDYNVDEILAKGLIPKDGNGRFKYPRKVHLIKGNVTDRKKAHIGWQLCQTNGNPLNDGHYTLIQIETALVPKSVAFYYDPRYEHGYYTKRRIPAGTLKVIGKIEYRKESVYADNYEINYI